MLNLSQLDLFFCQIEIKPYRLNFGTHSTKARITKNIEETMKSTNPSTNVVIVARMLTWNSEIKLPSSSSFFFFFFTQSDSLGYFIFLIFLIVGFFGQILHFLRQILPLLLLLLISSSSSSFSQILLCAILNLSSIGSILRLWKT